MIRARSRPVMTAALAAGVGLGGGCAAPMAAGMGGAVISTTGPSRSMMSLFETEAGVVIVDLGWWGAEGELLETLARKGLDRSDVAAVFLTHAHRDHIAAWPAVRSAVFYLAAAEAPYLFGELEYEGWVPRLADRLVEPEHPERDDLVVRTFSADTALVMGLDTIHAFLVPGHTPGSTAYLMRGILFAGDAVARTVLGGFRPARGIYSDDFEESEASLRSLFERLEAYDVRVVCTAHGRCGEYTEEFRRDALGEDPVIRRP
jgi:glyoxylase-like metal-dependent hydrolase (beta-lactamase superfamily II)